MLLKSQAIVLQNVKHGDTSLIVKLFTREKGCVSYIVNGVRSPKAKFKASFFMPLSIIEIISQHKEVIQLQRIQELRVEYMFVEIHADPLKNSLCLFIQEVLNKVLRFELQTVELFDFVRYSLEVLDQIESGKKYFHLQFLLKLSAHLGYSFSEHAELVYGTDRKMVDALEELKKEHYGLENQISFSIKTMLDYLLRFYAKHIDNFLPLKSLDVLAEVHK
ncbi:MAG: DNA repair protein RecO [Cytophagales bacterium]